MLVRDATVAPFVRQRRPALARVGGPWGARTGFVRRFEHLKALLGRRYGPLDRLPVTVTPRHAEAGTATGALLSETGAWGYPVLAVFDSWTPPLLVFLLFATLELITGNFIEPMLYGAHTGISALAQVRTFSA